MGQNRNLSFGFALHLENLSARAIGGISLLYFWGRAQDTLQDTL